MNTDTKRKTAAALFAVSVIFNVLFLVFFGFAVSGKTSSFSFRDMREKNTAYVTGACIVSVPERGADLVFGPAEFTLLPGEKAAYQFSAFLDGRQLNMAPEPLYDHTVIAVEKSGYGLLIEARAPGEAVVQTITTEGIRDLARVTVAVRKAAYPPHAGGPQVEAD